MAAAMTAGAQCGVRRQRRTGLCALLIVVALQLAAPATAAPLPIHLRWLESVVPPTVVGRALNLYFQSIPMELCAMGPDAIGSLPPVATNQICPLKAVSRLEAVVPGLDHDAKIEAVAANPLTFGGALMLLAADNVTQAADLQKTVCKVLLYPRRYCNFTRGDHVGPLFHRLGVDTSDAVGQWLLQKTVPVALAPLGASMAGLPDMLCRLPSSTLNKIPQEMRWDLCPYDVSMMSVMTMAAMGRTGSGTLHAKLCDLLKRPQEACRNGKYEMNMDTAEKITEFTKRSNVVLSSLDPRLQLPQLAMPNITAAVKGPVATISDWWVNQTMPLIRRSTITALIPSTLQPPAAALLERLPASVCSLAAGDIAKLPWAFKREVCPLGSLLKPHTGEMAWGLQSWGVTLAEVTMGAAGARNTSSGRARVDAWVAKMCSVMYAPEVACAGNTTFANSLNGTVLESGPAAPANATDLAVARIATDYRPIGVKVLSAALAAMSPTARKQLTDGLAKQADTLPTLVGLLPREVSSVALLTLCYVAAPLPTLEVDDSAPLLQQVAAGKAYTNEALEIFGMLVGEDKSHAVMARLCDMANPTPEPEAKPNVLTVFKSTLSKWQGAAAKIASSLLPTQGAAAGKQAARP
ncbi:MAG: hypothetical protein J3K34DRAFT_438597 [Monoraphidium minutum]|nr:MAG: hypothetical protein J3K34DRAFT_438597 [Monoraphidium minutum]